MTPPTVVSVSPANGAVGVLQSSAVTITFSESINPSSATAASLTLTAAGQTSPIAATVSATAATATLTPNAPLTAGTTYTLRVSGQADPNPITDLAGNALSAPFSSSFTSLAVGSSWTLFGSAPGGASGGPDSGQSITLGVKIRVLAAGYVSTVRFYRPYSTPGDTYIGSVYAGSGGLALGQGSITVPDGTPIGWVQIPNPTRWVDRCWRLVPPPCRRVRAQRGSPFLSPRPCL